MKQASFFGPFIDIHSLHRSLAPASVKQLFIVFPHPPRSVATILFFRVQPILVAFAVSSFRLTSVARAEAVFFRYSSARRGGRSPGGTIRSHCSCRTDPFRRAAFFSPIHSDRAKKHHPRSHSRLATTSDVSRRMTAQDIDGKAIAQTIRNELKVQVADLKEKHDRVPGLAVILVGSRRDSQTYVRMKKKACEECGIASFGYDYPDTVTQAGLVGMVHELNRRDDVHGILIQLPLPAHIDENAVLNAVDRAKDVDGLTALNTASLCSTSTHAGSTKLNWSDFTEIPFHIACTPQGCIELLDRSGVELRGKNAVVIGRSNLVGLPVSMLLMHRDATVTIVHSKTVDAPSVVRNADVVVAAVGRPGMVKADWLKPGCVVIDVGINSVNAPETKRGYRLVGDVDYSGVKEVAGMITPVPGGVGPMTIAMLLRNTVNSCRRSD